MSTTVIKVIGFAELVGGAVALIVATAFPNVWHRESLWDSGCFLMAFGMLVVVLTKRFQNNPRN